MLMVKSSDSSVLKYSTLIMALIIFSVTGCGKPKAVITATPQKGIAPLTVIFDASKSTDKKNDIKHYYWSFSDRDTIEAPMISLTPGQKTVPLIPDGNFRMPE